MANTTTQYGNESIQLLKDEQRVRQKPAVIFGSDGLEGCEHAAFEILSNAIDEAREGHGSLVTLTYFEDKSIEVEDFGRGCPLDWNPNEKRWNWELVFCELYAGWFSASSMPEENIKTMKAETMTILSVPTVSAPVQPSTPLNIWM